MLVLISPAKVINSSLDTPTEEYTLPKFGKEAQRLIAELREYSVNELSELFNVNINIAQQNAERFLRWHYPHMLGDAKQALFTYDGAVFRAIAGKTMSQKTLDYSQEHLRILSGLYGILKPLDLIMPYRLDVSTRLENDWGRDLYPFWREKVTHEVNAICKKTHSTTILNLMSKEYFKILNKKKIDYRIVTVDFLEYQPDIDSYKPIVIYTKQARGLMTRYVMQNQITNSEELKLFDGAGYEFSHKFSTKDNLIFVR